MKLAKIYLLLLTLFVLSGCMSGSSYYIISVASKPQKTYPVKKRVMGVEKITVPSYLYKREIAISDFPSHIILLNSAKWGEDLDSGLTNRLIAFLQKKFNQPDVYMYPWDTYMRPDIKISVHITRFIAQKDIVYLDASWSLENAKTTKRVSSLFSTKVDTKSDIKSIVHAMNTAFTKFEKAIALGISKL